MPILIYILAVLAANLTATLFIPFPLFGQVAVGTLIFGLTFTQRDRMHVYGRKVVYAVIGTTALLTLLLLVSFKYLWGAPLIELCLRGGSEWLAEGFGYLREGGVRVFAASVLAILIAESMDTEVYHRLRERSWMVRVLGSNAVSIPVDSAVFNLVAFAGIFGWKMLAAVIFGEIVTKTIVGTLYAFIRPRSEDKGGASFKSLPVV
ncbi:MAG: queuosine precursor transporter [Verrucomicrobiota bacterium JB022]|nr:queuosine precursor transporter [Verrucomicrobiota bacterium JB022]